MAGHGRLTAAKRQRERDLAERRREKIARRTSSREQRKHRPHAGDGVDPDIAHIVPGPQPPPSWFFEH
jgi:hypothetical protein